VLCSLNDNSYASRPTILQVRRKFHVIVVGGGPAGSAAALTLSRRGYSVAVIERSEYADTRVGETLPPAIRKLLVALGVWDQFVAENHSPSFGIRSAWGNDDLHENDFIFNPYGSGWHVDRNRFDRMLAAAAEKDGVEVFRGAELISLNNTPGKWEITIACGHRHNGFTADFLIDATGRRCSLARRQGAKRISYDHLIGLVGFLSPKCSQPIDDSFTLVEAQPEGWWYSATLPDRRLIAAYMTDSDLCVPHHASKNFWLRQLQGARHTFSRAKDYSLQSALTTFAANSSRLDSIVGQGWLAAGDAAAAHDPLSSQGVYRGLESGLLAAKAIDDHQSGHKTALQDYASAIIAGFDSYLLMRDKHYGRERRWPHSIFWRRRLSSSQLAAAPGTA
jgi:flavin-dependent dehydrogenase